MSRGLTLSIFYFLVFIQASSYGMTFMLPKLFATFNADEKAVGATLIFTAASTVIAAFYSGHITDILGRPKTLALAGISVSCGLFLFGQTNGSYGINATAATFLGIGWSLIYTLSPVIIMKIVKRDERIRFFTILSVFNMAGFGLSPVFTDLLVRYVTTINGAFVLFAMLCLFSGIGIYLLSHAINMHIPRRRLTIPSPKSI